LTKKKISNKIDFKRVFYIGKRNESINLKVFILKNQYSFNRLGIVIKKHVGIAVKRNKIKRQLKEIFNCLDRQLFQGHDIIIFVKKSAAKLDYIDFLRELENSFLKSNILTKKIKH